ncbi:hypothetical protein YDYSY3_22420 [Paenibacillus chitinolyticus]|nr:hypothetical protein YDYSY3_22420 [Paenibacillus chitinolyticus]
MGDVVKKALLLFMKSLKVIPVFSDNRHLPANLIDHFVKVVCKPSNLILPPELDPHFQVSAFHLI